MTRFVLPQLDESWRALPLGELAEIKYGSALTTSSRAINGEVPVYGSGGVVGTHDEALHARASIVVGRKGSVGSIFLTEGPFWCIDTAYYLDQLNDAVNLEYLAAYLQSLDLSRLAISVAVPGLNRKELALVPVPLPTLPEQQRIVDILQQAEAVANLRNEFDELLARTQRQLFVEMFGDPSPKFNSRWPAVKLGTFVSVGTGGTPSRDQPDSYGGTLAWVKSTDLKDDAIRSTEERVSELGIQSSNAKTYPKQTVMLGMYGQGQTRGRTGKLLIEAACNQACAALLPSDELLPDYLWVWLQLSYESVRSLGRGGQQENLNLDIVRGIKLPKPPVLLQQEFSRRLTALLEAVKESRCSRHGMATLLDALRIEALTGEATSVWREQHDTEIAVAAETRDMLLRERGTKLGKPAAEPKPTPTQPADSDRPARHWLRGELSEFQRQVLAAFVAYPHQPLLAEVPDVFADFCDDEQVSKHLRAFGPNLNNRIRRTLSQLAALGLIAKVTLPKHNLDTGERDYLKAFRPLRSNEFTRMADVVALCKALSADEAPHHFTVTLDFETSEHAGAGGMFQVADLRDENDAVRTELVDQGMHYATLDELTADIARRLGVPASQVVLEE
jgi:type I restriction enzyme S subunit